MRPLFINYSSRIVNYWWFFIFAAISSGLFFYSSTAFANTTTIVVSPAVIETPARPGDSAERTITVRNGGENPVPISLSVGSFVYASSDNFVTNENYDAKSWIKLEQDTYLFSAGETKQIPIFINVPENASPGGHYAQINVRGLSVESLEQNANTIIIPEVSVGVLFVVAGDIIDAIDLRGALIVPFQAEPKSTISSKVTVYNSGNVHNIISPQLIIYKDDTEIRRIFFEPKLVLPEQEMKFLKQWAAPADYGQYNVQTEIKYGSSGAVEQGNMQKLLVTPPLHRLVFLAIMTWISLYGIMHRKNLKKAWHELVK